MIGKHFQKVAEDDPNHARIPPGQYLTQGFPVLTYGQTPEVTQDSWQLRIWGEIEGPERILSWSDLMALPQHTLTTDFHCVTRWSKLDVIWTGVRVTDLLQDVQILSTAQGILQHCSGGYTTNLSLEDFVRPDNFLVHTLEGKPLPAEHGGPLRSLVPHLYAWKSAKWLSGLEFLAQPQAGFWERNGYHDRGDPWTEERYS